MREYGPRVGGAYNRVYSEKCECLRVQTLISEGVDPKIAVHILHKDPSARPVK